MGPLSDLYFLNRAQTKFACVGFSPRPPHRLVVTVAKCGLRRAVALSSEQWHKLTDADPVVRRRIQDPECRLREHALDDELSLHFADLFGAPRIRIASTRGHSVSLDADEWNALHDLRKLVSDLLYHKAKEEADVRNQILAYQRYLHHVGPENVNFTGYTRWIRCAAYRTYLEVDHYLKQRLLRQT